MRGLYSEAGSRDAPRSGFGSLLRVPAIPLPLATPLFGILALAYIVPGLVGHDPWKTEDAVGIGIVHQMLAQGRWGVLHLAGEPYLADGPLFYWVGAGLAKLLSPLLALHDAARLTSGAMIAVMLAAVYASGRLLCGRHAGQAAALVVLGCLGLVVHAHETLAETAMLAGQAIALLGIVLAPRRALLAGVLLGAGTVTAVLSKGTAAAFMPAVAALAAPIVSSAWRHRGYALTLTVGAAVAAAAIAGWLAALDDAASRLALGFLQRPLRLLPSVATAGSYLQILAWSAWPAWPVALWALWEGRRRALEPGTRVLLVAAAAAFLVLTGQHEAREVNALSILVPLSLLAGAGAGTLRRGAANALAWFAATVALAFGSLVWLGWFAMTTGFPERIARNFAKLEPGHVQYFASLPFALALAMTAAFLWLVLRAEHSVWRGVTCWCAGLTLVWGLLMTLWLSWIDFGKSYRPVAQALQGALPAGRGCIESRGLGEAQRAAFDYHAGVVTRRSEVHGDTGCPLLLVQSLPGAADRPGAEWRVIWEGSRPRARERYRLYRKL